MSDEQELRDACERFYAAVQAVLHGDDAPMCTVWSHGDEASYCDPRGEIVAGWLALEAYWKQAAAINATAPARLSATGHIKRVVVNGDLGYVVALEEVRQEGDPSVMTARATLVYRRDEDSRWRLLHRHADAAPKTNQPKSS